MATPYDMNQPVPTIGIGSTLPGSSGGGIDPSLIQGIISLITGAGNLGTAGSMLGYGREAAGMADPFASQRGQYQPQLHDLMTNPNSAYGMMNHLIQDPSSITSLPGYQFGLSQGTEALNRGAGASGMLNSGNRGLALEQFGIDYGTTKMDDYLKQLMGVSAADFGNLSLLSGATTGNPAAAGQDLLTGVNSRNNAIGTGIGGIATGVAGVLPSILRLIQGGGGGGGIPGVGGAGDGSFDWTGSDYGTTSGPDMTNLFNTGGGPFQDPTLGGFVDPWDVTGFIP